MATGTKGCSKEDPLTGGQSQLKAVRNGDGFITRACFYPVIKTYRFSRGVRIGPTVKEWRHSEFPKGNGPSPFSF